MPKVWAYSEQCAGNECPKLGHSLPIPHGQYKTTYTYLVSLIFATRFSSFYCTRRALDLDYIIMLAQHFLPSSNTYAEHTKQ